MSVVSVEYQVCSNQHVNVTHYRSASGGTTINRHYPIIVCQKNNLAQRISAAENMQREDLSAIETIEAIVEIVDAELIEDIEYSSMGKTSMDRVKTLSGKLDSVRRSEAPGYEVAAQARKLPRFLLLPIKRLRQ